MKKDNFLTHLKPLFRLFPEVPKPKKKVPLRVKVLWTLCALIIYLVGCQIPLYGVINDSTSATNPTRVPASKRATMMELGLTAVIHSGMVMQFLSGEILGGALGQKDLLDSAQKLLHVVVIIVLALYNVYIGSYGPFGVLGGFRCVIIMAQLVAGGIIVVLLDDALQRGYGLASAVSLFIAANSCERIVWEAFSPLKVNGEYQGAILHLLAALFSPNKLHSLFRAFFRQEGSNVLNVISTVLMFALIVYVQGFRIEIPIQSSRAKGLTSTYPIRLFYTNSVPIMLQSVIVTQVLNFAQAMGRRFPDSRLVSLLGRWGTDGLVSYPVGGICYYLSPSRSIYHFVTDPIHSVLYVAFMLGSCAYVSLLWMNAGSGSPKEVAKDLHAKKMIIKGHRLNATVRELNRYIPTAALMGGICVGAITVIADLIDSVGSGTGILLAVSTIQQISEVFAKEAISF